MKNDNFEKTIEIISQMTEEEKCDFFKSIGLKPDIEKIFNIDKKKKKTKKLIRKN